MPLKRAKLRDERPFQCMIRHEIASQFICYTQVGVEITADSQRHG